MEILSNIDKSVLFYNLIFYLFISSEWKLDFLQGMYQLKSLRNSGLERFNFRIIKSEKDADWKLYFFPSQFLFYLNN